MGARSLAGRLLHRGARTLLDDVHVCTRTHIYVLPRNPQFLVDGNGLARDDMITIHFGRPLQFNENACDSSLLLISKTQDSVSIMLHPDREADAPTHALRLLGTGPAAQRQSAKLR